MKLVDLEKYENVTIQCHDNPDADTVGSGYALYTYFKSKGKMVRLIYSGYNQIKKANMKLLIEKLEIPIEYIRPDSSVYFTGLLLTVDCQYGAGNVECFKADTVASIDHHPMEIQSLELYRIQPTLGSCSTLVWRMLKEAGYPVNTDLKVGTALYYGLYTDTNQFSELSNPLDLDMREALSVNERYIVTLRNSNISLKELEIAGIALIRYNYIEDYRFAVIKAQPCDPNILGLISDFLLQVDEIDICVVYNEINDGYKFSVRSCVKEVKANELAAYLTEGIGSGGGHYIKAGGFVSGKLYAENYPGVRSEAYFRKRSVEYFRLYTIISSQDVNLDFDSMKKYRRREEQICYIRAMDMVRPGTQISLRMQEGMNDLYAEEDLYFTLERNGLVRIMNQSTFEKHFISLESEVPNNYCVHMEYVPTLRNVTDGVTYKLIDHARLCIPGQSFQLYAMPLRNYVKVFPEWDEDNYLVGKPGDYLVVRTDDLHDVFIESGEDFEKRYEEI